MKNFISLFFSNLKKNISTVPFSIKCILRIIADFIEEKYPKKSKLERNAFLAHFLFSKLVQPILVNPDFSGVVDTNYIGGRQRNFLMIISKIIKNLTRGIFFDNVNHFEFTVFNRFFIEMFPEVVDYFDELIDLCLAKDESQEDTFFQDNPNEIVKMESICFSAGDILFILEATDGKEDTIQNISIKKCLNRVRQGKRLLSKHEGEHVKPFYLIFNLKFSDSFKLSINQKGEDNHSVKYCLRKILRGIGTLNPNIYTSLANVSNLEEALSAISQIVNVFDKSISVSSSVIPLSWYILYLQSNLSLLEEDLRKDGYSNLIKQIIEEERESISDLYSKTNTMMSKLGLNIRTAQKKTEMAEVELFKIKQIERKVKLSKFKSVTTIPVCVRLNKIQEESSNFFGFLFNSTAKEGESSKEPTISVTRQENCVHQKLKYIEKLTDGKNPKSKSKNSKNIEDYHSSSVENFAKNLLRYKAKIVEDIESGKNANKIYQTISDYMVIVENALSNSPIFADSSNKAGTENEKMFAAQLNKLIGNIRNARESTEISKLSAELNKVQTLLDNKSKGQGSENKDQILKMSEEIEKSIHRKIYKLSPSN